MGPHCLGPPLWALLEQHISPPSGRWASRVGHVGGDAAGGGGSGGARVLGPVDDHLGEVGQELGRLQRAAAGDLEEGGVPLDEGRGCGAAQKLWVAQHVVQEQYVGLDTANCKLVQGALHLLHRSVKRRGVCNDLGTEVAVKTHTHTHTQWDVRVLTTVSSVLRLSASPHLDKQRVVMAGYVRACCHDAIEPDTRPARAVHAVLRRHRVY